MVGDLKNGRTVHSLVKLLSLYSVSLIFVAPPSLSMPESVKAEAERAGIPVFETTSLTSVIGRTDVLYVTRVQQERFASQAEYDAVKDSYVVNNELLAGAKEHCIVMHPLPRNAELDPSVDVSARPTLCLFSLADGVPPAARRSQGRLLEASSIRPLRPHGSARARRRLGLCLSSADPCYILHSLVSLSPPLVMDTSSNFRSL